MLEKIHSSDKCNCFTCRFGVGYPCLTYLLCTRGIACECIRNIHCNAYEYIRNILYYVICPGMFSGVKRLCALYGDGLDNDRSA
jgi:hypothetical protein